MTENLRIELLRNQLRSGNVKLWLAPYVAADGNPNHEEIEKLAEQYSSKFNMNVKSCGDMLCTIQNDAVKKLQERNTFRASNLATVYIRCKGFSEINDTNTEPSTSISPNVNGSSQQIKIEISLAALAQDLENELVKNTGASNTQLKLIFDGRVLKKEESLQAQGVKNSSRILALVVEEYKQDVHDTTSHQSLFSKTRSAVSTLCNRSDDKGVHYLELEDQQGCSLSLDAKEKESLFLSMTFHERGRAALKRGDLLLGLVLFLEADQEFQNCSSELLKTVDNLALLNLDIVWCYLCLRSITHISDAEKRLQQCEAIFDRAYGKNLERVAAMKGSSGNEEALMARLHLLQAIVLFHQNKLDAARRLLKQTEVEIQALKVSEEDVKTLMALGFTASEALMGLRACDKSVEVAVEKIIQERADRKNAIKENAKKRALDRERRKLGKTADGSQYIEPANLKQIVIMGYDKYLALSALKHSNNNITQAVHLLQEQPHLLDLKRRCVRVSSETIAQVAALGFDVDIARIALKKHNGSIQQAVDDLVSNNGVVELYPGMETSLDEECVQDMNEPEVVEEQVSEEQLILEEEEQERQLEASIELKQDITSVTNDHLNISFEMEEKFLQEYLTLLNDKK